MVMIVLSLLSSCRKFWVQGGVGGKLHVFLSSLPKVGSKALSVRDMGSKASDKEPLKNMAPASTDYRRMAESAAESMASSLELHIFSGDILQIAIYDFFKVTLYSSCSSQSIQYLAPHGSYLAA